jgi:diacylglycerol kinase family enzyme
MEPGVKRQHLFIINPKSFPIPGAMDTAVGQILGYFASRGSRNFTIRTSTYPREAIIIIREFLKITDADTIVRVYAVGGDGIAFDCLNGIVGLPNTELALVPYGSSNDFVRNFGEGLIETFRNIKLQVEAPIIPTDIIRCSNNQQTLIHSLGHCVFGVEAASAFNIVSLNKRFEKWPNALRQSIKSFLYILGGILAAFDKTVINQNYQIIADGKDISGCYATINISNAPCYGGGKNPVITANPTDGELDMLIAHKMNPFALLKWLPAYLQGKCCTNVADFSLHRVKKLTITTESPFLLVNLDGEAFFDTQATVEIIPLEVQIVAPNGMKYRQWEVPHD